MIKKLFFFYVVINFLNVSWASAVFINSETTTFQQLVNNFSKVDKHNLPGKPIDKNRLPTPYDFLLTQPLMTLGIEQYYQRTPIIQTIYAVKNQKNNQYSRVIIMLLDKDKARNNAEIAQEKKEEVVVETAVISMNFKELPEKVKAGVLNTNIPFGKLLVESQLKTANKDQAYFSIRCSRQLAALTHCKINNRIFGRVNTIVRADNKKWIARMIEILPGVTRKDIKSLAVDSTAFFRMKG